MLTSPPFGQADLSNCERELIHLAGSVQPHGLLLALREPGLRIIQASANVGVLLGVGAEDLLNQPAAELGGDLVAAITVVCTQFADLSEPAPLRCHLKPGGRIREFEGMIHRVNGDVLLVELEPVDSPHPEVETVNIPSAQLRDMLGAAVQRLSVASTIGTLSDGAVRCLRDLLGYDRVMVYKFDPDGHGKIIAEARDPRLESLLGHHYPATDIPQRARELYLRNRCLLYTSPSPRD